MISQISFFESEFLINSVGSRTCCLGKCSHDNSWNFNHFSFIIVIVSWIPSGWGNLLSEIVNRPYMGIGNTFPRKVSFTRPLAMHKDSYSNRWDLIAVFLRFPMFRFLFECWSLSDETVPTLRLFTKDRLRRWISIFLRNRLKHLRLSTGDLNSRKFIKVSEFASADPTSDPKEHCEASSNVCENFVAEQSASDWFRSFQLTPPI